MTQTASTVGNLSENRVLKELKVCGCGQVSRMQSVFLNSRIEGDGIGKFFRLPYKVVVRGKA